MVVARTAKQTFGDVFSNWAFFVIGLLTCVFHSIGLFILK